MRTSNVFLARGPVKVWIILKIYEKLCKRQKEVGFRAARRKKDGRKPLERSPLHDAAREEGAEVHGEVVDGGATSL